MFGYLVNGWSGSDLELGSPNLAVSIRKNSIVRNSYAIT